MGVSLRRHLIADLRNIAIESASVRDSSRYVCWLRPTLYSCHSLSIARGFIDGYGTIEGTEACQTINFEFYALDSLEHPSQLF